MLFISGFLFTCYAEDMTSQEVLTRVDNPITGFLCMGAFILLLLLCCNIACRKPTTGKRVLMIIVFGWIICIGGILVLFGRTAPAADAWSVYSAAENLAMGNTSVIHPTDSYLSYYPQQIGLMAFFELIIRLWKILPTDLQAYHFIKVLYVLLTWFIVYYQYSSVHLLWEDDRADCIYLILAGANLPLIMYSSFVYGEIPSFAALSIGCYYLLKILKSTKIIIPHGILSILFLMLSVMLRKNSLVIIIAVIIVTVLEGIKTNRRGLLLLACICLVSSLSILPSTLKIYELRSGSTLSSGVPAMSYFAMGMQESSRGNGWYNGYNFNTYQETGMDAAATSDISREFMNERTLYFREHPGYAADFYGRKFLSQWADGTYASRQATLATFGGRNPIVESFYSGDNSKFYIEYCNIFQNILYLGCFIGILFPLLDKKRIPLYLWLGITGVFGGFLFHMIWEANSRYIFLYGLMMMPYASYGLSRLSNTFVLGIFRRNNTDRKPDATEAPTTAA